MKRIFSALLILVLLSVSFGALAATTWYCPQCGRKNDSNYCPNDGTARPSDLSVPARVSVGSILYFGEYEQDNNYSNGKEDIAWQVLAVQGNEALLIAQYGLDLHLIHPYSANVTWESCEMRSWLNSTFINEAFSYAQQRAILTKRIANDESTGYRFPAIDNPHPQYCQPTYDRLFLLSWQETQQYFSGDMSRRCKPTPYAAAKGALVMSNGYCWWWLRSPGYTYNMAMAINSQGTRVPGDQHVHNDNKNTGMVRPAFWIDLTQIGK